MKTPDEIKKAVSLCPLCGRCANCPYRHTGCMVALSAVALAYIEQLEAERKGKNDERNAKMPRMRARNGTHRRFS